MAVSLITEEPGVDLCMLEINMKYEVKSYVVCSICLSFGLIYCFLGYRCFKMVMFLSGFMFGTIAILLLYHKEPLLDIQLGIESKAGICLGVGVLCGLMTTLAPTLGLFLSGLQLGTLLTFITLVVIGQFYSLTPSWVPFTSMLVVSISTAVFMLKWQRIFSIFYTSVFGATTVMLGVEYLVGTFMLPDQVYDLFGQVDPNLLCWFDWVIIAICPVLSLLGVLVQWKFTAKGISHREATYEKQKKLDDKHRYRECRRRTQSHRRSRRRGPPPLKRYAGDVLAPSYIQSLQERQMGTGSSSSSVSTITHTLIDFDFETGSMVPLTATSSGFTV